MIRIAIVEDEEPVRRDIVDKLMAYAEQNETAFELEEFADGADLIEDYQPRYDVILLDIQMPGSDGMGVARAIRKTDEDVQIVFVTNLAQRATEGYDVDAKAFIVKPVNRVLLFRQMDRVLREARRRKGECLVLGNTRELKRVHLEDILYIDSKNHYVKIHTRQGTVVALSSMRKVEEQLEGKQFFRCSNSSIVNLDAVTSVTSGAVMVGDVEVSVSRARRKDFMQALNRRFAGSFVG